ALTLYLTCVVASFELQRRDVRDVAHGRDAVPLRLPLGPLVPAMAAIVMIWMLSHATRKEFLIEGAVLAVAAGFYAIRARSARSPRGPPTVPRRAARSWGGSQRHPPRRADRAIASGSPMAVRSTAS